MEKETYELTIRVKLLEESLSKALAEIAALKTEINIIRAEQKI